MAQNIGWAGNLASGCSRAALDLSRFEKDQRTSLWLAAAAENFPGLSLKMIPSEPQHGTLKRFRLGNGELFSIESGPVEIAYRPTFHSSSDPYLSLMLQSQGSTFVGQSGQTSLLKRGDICLIDEGRGFDLISEGVSGIHFVRLPRKEALGRHPDLKKLLACSMPSTDIGVQMLAGTILRLSHGVAGLVEYQRAAMMSAILQMIGVVGAITRGLEAYNWRVLRALDCIRLNLSVSGLTADDVARDQRIGRRRLDQLMRESVGHRHW